MKFIIQCKVSGGVTGTRFGIYKKNGVVQEFDTREEADAMAKSLVRAMNHEKSVAKFEYWAEEL